MKNLKVKEIIYYKVVNFGFKFISFLFPEFCAQDSTAPYDRYIEYPFALENLPSHPAKILDVGCAGSFFPLLLAGLGYETYGMDIRKYTIINKIEFKNFRFLEQDITKTSFAADYFDAVTLISTLEHIGISGRYGEHEDLEKDKSVVQEIKRILKPNGTIILTLPFGKAKIFRPHCRVYDSKRINWLAEGLRIEKEDYFLREEAGDWRRCRKQEIEEKDLNIRCPTLCLLKIIKDK